MQGQTSPRPTPARDPLVPPAVAQVAIARHLYRLTVLCGDDDAFDVEAGLKGMLSRHRLVPLELERQRLQPPRTRIVVRVASSIVERAALVRIVNQLAADPAVRCLQWETDPRS